MIWSKQTYQPLVPASPFSLNPPCILDLLQEQMQEQGRMVENKALDLDLNGPGAIYLIHTVSLPSRGLGRTRLSKLRFASTPDATSRGSTERVSDIEQRPPSRWRFLC